MRRNRRVPQLSLFPAIRVALVLTAVVLSTPSDAYYDANAGKPASKPLPPYCQMGQCFVQTVEAIDPVLFVPGAVLFRVESQNWQGGFDAKSLKRTADSASYVLCSKKAPATIDQTGGRTYMVTFLTPNDGGFYNHANETALSLYFTVCHARSFGKALYNEGPIFAASLGYSVRGRDDQPTVDSLDKVMEFAR